MKFLQLLLALSYFFISCNNSQNSNQPTLEKGTPISINYAEGFSITNYQHYYQLDIHNPWPNSNNSFSYALVKNPEQFKPTKKFDAIVNLPIQNIVVTSTTHVASLDNLGHINKLIGFPGLNSISSPKARHRIDKNKIIEIGANENLNIETIIKLQPQALIGFSVTGINQNYNTLKRAGIPIIYNGDWNETHPLGKAEWIKFFGLLFNNLELADSIFSEIEYNYNQLKNQTKHLQHKPTVISGALWNDLWYMPQGQSWAAQLINDAGGNYLWSHSKGTGSIALSIENILEKAYEIDFWIGPAQFTSLNQLEKTNSAYTQIKAFQNQNIYSFSTLKGETGGIIYYEQAPNRPDIVLKDIIKILHPNLVPNHPLHFYRKLK